MSRETGYYPTRSPSRSFIYFPLFFLSVYTGGELEKRREEKMGKKKKRRVPEVLWRLYRDRARSLSHTVTYVFTQTQLPPSSSNTSGAENDKSFLLKPDDPSDYRNLLNNCFIVISDNAPPLPSHFSLRNRWSQHQVTTMPRGNIWFFFVFPKSLLFVVSPDCQKVYRDDNVGESSVFQCNMQCL